MKKNEIKVGGYYQARISGNFVTVLVEGITKRERNPYRCGGTSYAILNLNTGRRTQFSSAMKFRREVTGPKGAKR